MVGAMKHKNSHLLVGYWSRLRKGREVPDQVDIDPRAIKRLLSQVFILDAANATKPVYRLAGTTTCDRFGIELRGTDFFAHWEAQSGAALSSLLRHALRLRQPLCLLAIGVTPDNGMVEIETVLAPLSFGNDEPTRFMGLMQVLGDATPLRGRTIAFERLVGSNFIHEDEPLPAVDIPPAPVAFKPALRVHPKAPHLRLLVSRSEPDAVHYEPDETLRRVLDAFNATLAAGDSKLVS
jgi:hypothetical protein